MSAAPIIHQLPAPPDPPEADAGQTGPGTGLANAERFIAIHGHRFRHVPAWGAWLAWDGARWHRDTTGEIIEAAKDVSRQLLTQATGISDDDDRKRAVRWALQTQGAARIREMVDLARSSLAIEPHDLDADPWLLNVANGVVDLRTGHLRSHDPSALLTKLAPVRYDPDAAAPTWERFLGEVLPDDEVREFVRRLTGYSITGTTSEQILAILWGTGANGKSVLCETIRHVIGDYALQVDPKLLTERDQHETGAARLQGTRLAFATETDQGDRLAEATVKRLTGSDQLTGRFMRCDFFEFAPSHQLWLVTNHRPVIRGTDHAIWRRIRLVPFAVVIPDEDQDHKLAAKLENESEGILAWAVAGCVRWQQDGLTTPTAVILATAGYRAEMDTIGDFINDATVNDATAMTTAAAMFDAYKAWCESNGEKPLSQKRLGATLTERGYDRAKDDRTRRWKWLGIAVTATHATHPTQESA